MQQRYWQRLFLLMTLLSVLVLGSLDSPWAQTGQAIKPPGGGFPWIWVLIGFVIVALIIVIMAARRGAKALDIPAQVVIVDGERAGAVIPLEKTRVTIGSEDDNNIVLTDEKIAKHHAELRYEKGSFSVVDLNSLYGIYVDGSRIEIQPIGDGETFSLANSVNLTLQIGGESGS